MSSDEDNLKLAIQSVQKSSTPFPTIPKHYRQWPCHIPPSPSYVDDPWPDRRAAVEFIKKQQKSAKFGGHGAVPVQYLTDDFQVSDLRLSELRICPSSRPQHPMAKNNPKFIEEGEYENSEVMASKRKMEVLPIVNFREVPLTRAEERFYDPVMCSPSNSRASLASVASLASIPEEMEVCNVETQTSRDYGLAVEEEYEGRRESEADAELSLIKSPYFRYSTSSSSPSSSEERYLLKRHSTQTESPVYGGTYLLRREGDEVTRNEETVNIIEAFGTIRRQKPKYEEKYKVVIEMKINGIMKRYLIPRKYARVGKWVFFGTRVYIFRGHSFIKYKAQPLVLKLCCCLGSDFRYSYDHFCCRDCHFRCIKINPAEVTEYCHQSSIDLQEMEFPYDSDHRRLI